MNKFNTLKFVCAAMFLALVISFGSCKKDSDPISGDIVSSVSNEATSQSQENEIDDMASTQMDANSAVTGRTQTTTDDRLACARITVLLYDKAGKIRINFDSTSTTAAPGGCVDGRGNTRKGLITIEWHGGKWYSAGSVITVSPSSYSINGVIINGQRVLTNITDEANPFVIVWTVVANHTFTWLDGTTSTRAVSETKTWDTKQGTVRVKQTNSNDFAVSGTNRQNKPYTVQINADVVYTAACATTSKVFIPVSGNTTLTLNGTTVLTFDYGSGTCDNTFTLTYKTFTETITVNNTGS